MLVMEVVGEGGKEEGQMLVMEVEGGGGEEEG